MRGSLVSYDPSKRQVIYYLFVPTICVLLCISTICLFCVCCFSLISYLCVSNDFLNDIKNSISSTLRTIFSFEQIKISISLIPEKLRKSFWKICCFPCVCCCPSCSFALFFTALFIMMFLFGLVNDRGTEEYQYVCPQKMRYLEFGLNHVHNRLKYDIYPEIKKKKNFNETMYNTNDTFPDSDACVAYLGCDDDVECFAAPMRRIYPDHCGWIVEPKTFSSSLSFLPGELSEHNRYVFERIANELIPIQRIFVSFETGEHLTYPERKLSKNVRKEVVEGEVISCQLFQGPLFEPWDDYNPIQRPAFRGVKEYKRFDSFILYDVNSLDEETIDPYNYEFLTLQSILRDVFFLNDRFNGIKMTSDDFIVFDREEFLHLSENQIDSLVSFFNRTNSITSSSTTLKFDNIKDSIKEGKRLFKRQKVVLYGDILYILIIRKHKIEDLDKVPDLFDKNNDKLMVVIIGSGHPQESELCSMSKQFNGDCYVVSDILTTEPTDEIMNEISGNMKDNIVIPKFVSEVGEYDIVWIMPYEDQFNRREMLTLVRPLEYEDENKNKVMTVVGIDVDRRFMKDYCKEDYELYLISSPLWLLLLEFKLLGFAPFIFLIMFCQICCWYPKCTGVCKRSLSNLEKITKKKFKKLKWWLFSIEDLFSGILDLYPIMFGCLFVIQSSLMLYILEYYISCLIILVCISISYCILIFSGYGLACASPKNLRVNDIQKTIRKLILPDKPPEKNEWWYERFRYKFLSFIVRLIHLYLFGSMDTTETTNNSDDDESSSMPRLTRLRDSISFSIDAEIRIDVKGGKIGGNYALQVAAGEVVAVMGHSGAGKSTFFRLLRSEQSASKIQVGIIQSHEDEEGDRIQKLKKTFSSRGSDTIQEILIQSLLDDKKEDQPTRSLDEEESETKYVEFKEEETSVRETSEQQKGQQEDEKDEGKDVLFSDAAEPPPMESNNNEGIGDVLYTHTDPDDPTPVVRKRRVGSIFSEVGLLREHCGFVPQFAAHPQGLTVSEQLFFISNYFGVPLSHFFHFFQEMGLGSPILQKFPGRLSGGEEKRFAALKVVLREFPIMLLDEPTSGLDGYTSVKLLESLKVIARKKGIGFLIVIHQPSDLVLKEFDRVYVLLKGYQYKGEGKKKQKLKRRIKKLNTQFGIVDDVLMNKTPLPRRATCFEVDNSNRSAETLDSLLSPQSEKRTLKEVIKKRQFNFDVRGDLISRMLGRVSMEWRNAFNILGVMVSCISFCGSSLLDFKLFYLWRRVSLEELRDSKALKIQLLVTVLAALFIVTVFNAVHPYEGTPETMVDTCVNLRCGDLNDRRVRLESCSSYIVAYSCSQPFHNPMFFICFVMLLGIGLIALIAGADFVTKEEKRYIVEEIRGGLPSYSYILLKFIARFPRNVVIVVTYSSLVFYAVYIQQEFYRIFLVVLLCYFWVYILGIILSLVVDNSFAVLIGIVTILIQNLYSGIFVTKLKLLHYTSDWTTGSLVFIAKYFTYSYFGNKLMYVNELNTYVDTFPDSVMASAVNLGYAEEDDETIPPVTGDLIGALIWVVVLHITAFMLFICCYDKNLVSKIYEYCRDICCCLCCCCYCLGNNTSKVLRSDLPQSYYQFKRYDIVAKYSETDDDDDDDNEDEDDDEEEEELMEDSDKSDGLEDLSRDDNEEKDVLDEDQGEDEQKEEENVKQDDDDYSSTSPFEEEKEEGKEKIEEEEEDDDDDDDDDDDLESRKDESKVEKLESSGEESGTGGFFNESDDDEEKSGNKPSNNEMKEENLLTFQVDDVQDNSEFSVQ